ncbi:MAG: hydrogenase, partial [Ramlibacter sp.]|nr:hydrogenase [Ramlibacter sp.]
MTKQTKDVRIQRRIRSTALGAVAVAVLAGCGGGDSPTNDLPQGITQLGVTTYSATTVGAGDTAATQDLLTGGIGRAGLANAVAPAYANAASPTAAELRRNALYSNYRGILDASPAGGFGTLYGPNVTVTGAVTASDGLIPGR